MSYPLLMKVENALVSLLQANAGIAALTFTAADGTTRPLQVMAAITLEGMDDSRITCEALEASSVNDRPRSGNFDVTVNVHIITALAEASVPTDGADANQDGVADAPPVTVDMPTLRAIHGARVCAVQDVLRIDTLPADLSATTASLGCYGHQFNGERQSVNGPFLVHSLSYTLRGVCDTDL